MTRIPAPSPRFPRERRSTFASPSSAQETEVPDLTNLTEEQAQDTLSKHNLLGRKGQDREDPNVEVGRVCDQSEDPGAIVDVNTTITYYLSSGSGEETIPSVAGSDEATARKTLEDAGFTVAATQYVNDDSVAEGLVVYTTPGANEAAEKGTEVTIFVSLGPAAPEEYEVQNVIGWSYSDAYAALSNSGFNPILATGSSAEGIVSSQSVTGTAPLGAEIVLTTRTPETTGGQTNPGETTTDPPENTDPGTTYPPETTDPGTTDTTDPSGTSDSDTTETTDPAQSTTSD